MNFLVECKLNRIIFALSNQISHLTLNYCKIKKLISLNKLLKFLFKKFDSLLIKIFITFRDHILFLVWTHETDFYFINESFANIKMLLINRAFIIILELTQQITDKHL
jgi:hypothetical protein